MRIKRLLFYATVSLFAIFLLWFVITNGKYMQMCNNKFLTLSLAGTSNKSLSLDNGLNDSNKSITDSTNETTVSETVSDSITDLASTNTDTTGVTNTINRYSLAGCTPTCALVPNNKGRMYNVAPLS